MDFSNEAMKKYIMGEKVRARVAKLQIEAISKEMEENKDKYSSEELNVLNELLQRAMKDHDKHYETYSKGTIIYGIGELKNEVEENFLQINERLKKLIEPK